MKRISPRTIAWVGGDVNGHIRLIDQTLLPGQLEYRECRTVEDVWEAIRSLRVRGAPAIGCAAAFGIALEAQRERHRAPAEFSDAMEAAFVALAGSRPTAVNLFWALGRMREVLAAHQSEPEVAASKAALNQLARIAALEWGADGIRVNTLHPNAVFDTGLWTEDVLAQRARQYGMTVEAYKTNNVLRTEVSSRDVAELAAEMCGPLFAKTTGAQVPVDGGNERVI